jgi:hypothetical protein
VKSSANAAKRKAQTALDMWNDRHMGPKWAAAAKMMPTPTRLISHLACGDEDSVSNPIQLARFRKAVTLWPGVPRRCGLATCVATG